MDSKDLKSKLWNKAKEIRNNNDTPEGRELAGLLEQASLRIENLAYFKQEVMERSGHQNYTV